MHRRSAATRAGQIPSGLEQGLPRAHSATRSGETVSLTTTIVGVENLGEWTAPLAGRQCTSSVTNMVTARGGSEPRRRRRAVT